MYLWSFTSKWADDRCFFQQRHFKKYRVKKFVPLVYVLFLIKPEQKRTITMNTRIVIFKVVKRPLPSLHQRGLYCEPRSFKNVIINKYT